MPALPLDEAGKYVAAAYVVFVGLILAYVAIMAAKLERIERELGELAEERPVRASDGVAVQNSDLAAPVAPEPDDSKRRLDAGRAQESSVDLGEASGGGVP
ncbi:MAG: hypothetical protein AABM66_04115 [Actinomycetota bacterium]